MKKAMIYLGIVMASGLIAACGKAGGSSSTTVVCNGTVVNGVCQTGGVITVPSAKAGTYGTYNTVTGTDSGGALRAFLKNAMGVCDTATWSWGNASCDQWMSGQWFIKFDIPSGNATNGIVTLRVYPSLTFYGASAGLYSPQGASCGVIYSGWTSYPYCEISFNATVSLINNSQGLEYRTYGAIYTPANRSLLQIQALDILTSRTEGSYAMKVFFPNNGSYQQIFSVNNVGRLQ